MTAPPGRGLGFKNIVVIGVLALLALVAFSALWRIFSLFVAASLLIFIGVLVSRKLLGVDLSRPADARVNADRDPAMVDFEARMAALDEESAALDRVIEDR